MRPADDPNTDYKALVERGYDQAAAAYAAARQREANPELDLVTTCLAPGSRVLDIGCGAGVPIAQTLAQQGHAVTGVDISGEQIRLARANVPGGTFHHADIMTMDFAAGSFAAVVSFYAIFHLPRGEHPELLRRVHRWLRWGGYLLATVTQAAEAAYTEDDFFGQTMYWSNFGLADYTEMLASLGFRLLQMPTSGHGYAAEAGAPPEVHPVILAQRV